MTKQEIVGLLNFLNAAYPSKVRGMTDEERKAQLTAWYLMFSNDDPNVVWQALREHVATSSYYPSIAEIRKGVRKRTMVSADALYERFKTIGWKAVHAEVIEEGSGRDVKYITKHYSNDDLQKEPIELRKLCGGVYRLRQMYDEYRYDEQKFKTWFVKEIEKLQEEIDILPLLEGGKE